MKLLKHVKLLGLCITALGAMSVFGLGTAGSASATILFLPASHKFPYHLAGTAAKPRLETVGGKAVEAEKVDILVLALSQSLFDTHLRFLKSKNVNTGAPCANTSNSGEILVNLLGHLGLADPGFVPAVLLLVPTGFKFTCELLGVIVTVLVKGSVIGQITSPAIGTESELLGLLFNQTSAGHQQFTTFLLGGQTLTNAFEESSENEGAFEQSAQSGPFGLVHALPGEGSFLLILP